MTMFDKMDKINNGSKTPKYQQVVNLILEDIESGRLKIGERISSINEMSFDFLLSRDTVEKAYNELKDRGIITSVKGKGFYVSSTNTSNKLKVLLLFNKLSSYKKIIYYSVLETLGEKATVDIHVHHYNKSMVQELLERNMGKYHYYVLAPHFYDEDSHLMDSYDIARQFPDNKLLIMDRAVKGHENEFPGVYQDFEKDIFHALEDGIEHLKKYQKLKLVYPRGLMYPPEIVDGFKKFCFYYNFDNVILDGIDAEPLYEGDVYITLAETDLVNVVKKSREQGLELGKAVGLISYNDTPLKEILADGITTISTDFEHMGKRIAELILGKSTEKVSKNPFKMTVRKTL